MKNIDKTDKNLAVKKTVEKDGMTFYDVLKKPYLITGLINDGIFRRMPEDIAARISDGVHDLSVNTAGGAVHFKTNSRKIAVKCKMKTVSRFSHMPLCGTSGFDIYIDNKYSGTFMPPYDMTDGYESCIDFANDNEKNVTVNFPLYNDVARLEIGLCSDAECAGYNPYGSCKPIVYYGSSITQGGCASRPGMAYQAIIARRLGRNYVNLGFSGSAMGEEEMAQYIAGLDMSVFVMDYDHNAPDAQHLLNTHGKFFKIIREKNPDLPIVLVSQINKYMYEADKRREIIYTTYKNAAEGGDKNVYFVDGLKICPDADYSVDNTHPTDYGFNFMAKAIGDALYMILNG